MELSLDDANFYLQAVKRVASGRDWQRRADQNGQTPCLFFESPVIIQRAMPRGLRFRISVFPAFPNVATFQLECNDPGTRTCLTLYRLEWRPLSGHSNKLGPTTPQELQGLFIRAGETHEHICTDNVHPVEQRIEKKGVRAARRVEPDFATYDDALSYVCVKMKIKNPDVIPPSNAQWELAL